jgi:hypothetical protein
VRPLAPAIAAHRAARVATHVELLLWVKARDRATNAVVPLGLWTGWDNQTISVNGVARDYYGAGTLLEFEPLETAVGLDVRDYSVRLSAISPEVELLVRGYDVKFAQMEIHRAEFDAGYVILAQPERVFKGTVEGSPIITPAIGGQGSIALTCVSTARNLTRYINLTKSDEMQRQRSGDRFRKFGSIAKEVDVVWGDKRKEKD